MRDVPAKAEKVHKLHPDPFEVYLTIFGAKIRHNHKWGSQPYSNFDSVIITPFKFTQVITTSFEVMPDFKPNNSQIYLKWIFGVDVTLVASNLCII
jgi:hypothetical protein